MRAPVVVCWDLDNTLVDSGALIRGGEPAAWAWINAEPVAGMLEFAASLRSALPEAAHVVLSVRPRGLRRETLAWLERNSFAVPGRAVWFVSSADDKPRVWRTLARGGRLVVVDDLTGGHEGPSPRPYDRLVAEAKEVADVYVGADGIGNVQRSPARASALAAEVAAAIRRS